MQLVPLQFLSPGQIAVIAEVRGAPGDLRRLAEMGLRRGVRLSMVRPGSPCIARVGTRDICLRLGDGLHVLAEVPEAA